MYLIVMQWVYLRRLNLLVKQRFIGEMLQCLLNSPKDLDVYIEKSHRPELPSALRQEERRVWLDYGYQRYMQCWNISGEEPLFDPRKPVSHKAVVAAFIDLRLYYQKQLRVYDNIIAARRLRLRRTRLRLPQPIADKRRVGA